MTNKIQFLNSSEKNLLLIYPYKKPDIFSYFDFFPPNGLEYIGAVLKSYLKSVTIIDLRYEKEDIFSFINKADIIGFGLTWDYQKEPAAKLIRYISELPEKKPVILGGVYSTDNAEKLLLEHENINLVVLGEGESIVKKIFSGYKFKDIPGITFRQGKKVISNPGRLLPDIGDIYQDRTMRRYKYVHSFLLKG